MLLHDLPLLRQWCHRQVIALSCHCRAEHKWIQLEQRRGNLELNCSGTPFKMTELLLLCSKTAILLLL